MGRDYPAELCHYRLEQFIPPLKVDVPDAATSDEVAAVVDKAGGRPANVS